MMNLNTTSDIENIVKKRITKKKCHHFTSKTSFEKKRKRCWRCLAWNFYRVLSEKYILTSPYGTDGFITPKENISLVFALRILLEFKDGTNLTFKKMSNDVVSEFKNNYFGAIFIDANHNFQFVKEDIEAWYKKLNNDGILIGHDFDYPNLPGIRKAVELEFKDNYNLEDDYVWWTKRR